MNKNLEFWQGSFGTQYIERNQPTHEMLSSVSLMFANILKNLSGKPLNSILEVGCNLGINLRALKNLTTAEIFGLEPFRQAVDICLQDKVVPQENLYHLPAQEMGKIDRKFDLVFTSGVLIHIPPQDLKKVTDHIVHLSNQYVLCIEYFLDVEAEIPYRGHSEVLFKRDFGSFYMDQYPFFECIDYGFIWKRLTGLDNLTWWLFEKR